MRRTGLLLVAVAVVATPAHADRQVEDWVGTWTGAATWSDCTVAGAEQLSVAVTWRDGGIWIDGAALYDGLGELGPEGRDGALVVDVADLQIEMRRAKTKTGKGRGKAKGKAQSVAVVELRTAAQCTMTAKLVRDGTGIEACDELVALASAAGACGVALDDDPADEQEAWSALTGKKRTRAGTACQGRATALRETLVAAECLAPDNDPSAVPECGETWATSQRLVRCQRMPAELQRSTIQGVAELRRSLRSFHGRAGARDLAAAKCVETTEILRDVADAYGC